jgi:hypothetical protein
MKYKILLGIITLTILVACTQKEEQPKICTMEYAPVCGKINVQCITTPCNPVEETFPNRCGAEAADAFDIKEGACEENIEINNFEDCIAAGNPAMESYPRQCRANGKTFVEEI